MSRSRRLLQAALAAVFAAAVVDFAGFKLRAWPPTPRLFSALMGAAALLALAEGILSLRDAIRGPPRLSRAGKAAALLGLVLTAAAGLGNWARAVRGFAVVLEGETVSLSGKGQLQALEVGLLGGTRDLDTLVRLEDLELRDTEDGYYPEAIVRVTRPGAEPERVSLLQDVGHPVGSLRIFLGAFGFAPRIVVLKGDETLLDETVPFTTRREGERGVAFEGEAEVGETGLRVVGAVDTESEDPGVRGHPTVWIALLRGEEQIGGGELKLGHFATTGDGYRVGVAGMKHWAEIDVGRRNRPAPVLAGLALAALGAAAWGVGAWRRR